LNPAIPLVKQLTVLVAKDDAEAAALCYWGATTRTSMHDSCFRMRKAFDILEADMDSLRNSLIQLAPRISSTPIAGRTLMQHALPTTFE